MDLNNIPERAERMLKEIGLNKDQIKIIKQKYGGTKNLLYIPNGSDSDWDVYCDEQINYLSNIYLNDLKLENLHYRAIAELAGTNKNRYKIIENYKRLKKREIGLCCEYYSVRDYGFIKNYKDYAFYTVDVRKTLGVKILSTNRYQKDKKGRPGCFAVANLAAAIDHGKLNVKDTARAKYLAKKIYNRPLAYSEYDIEEFDKILCKIPKYNSNAMTWHEDCDGFTLNLLPSGKLHQGSDTGGIPHKGGNVLIKAAEKIINFK